MSTEYDHPRGLPEPSPQDLKAEKLGREHNAAAVRMHTLTMRSTPASFAEAIRAGARFKASSLTGHPVEGWPARGVPHPSPGWTGELRASLLSARYVVMSGQDPIAWLTHGGWVIPVTNGQSRTISRHQDLMRKVAALWS